MSNIERLSADMRFAQTLLEEEIRRHGPMHSYMVRAGFFREILDFAVPAASAAVTRRAETEGLGPKADRAARVAGDAQTDDFEEPMVSGLTRADVEQ